MDMINLFREMSIAGVRAAKVDESAAFEISKAFSLLSLDGSNYDASVKAVFRHGVFLYGVYVEIAEENYLS